MDDSNSKPDQPDQPDQPGKAAKHNNKPKPSGRYKSQKAAMRARALLKRELMRRAVELRNAGWGTGDIANELGYMPETIRNWLRKQNVPLRRQGGANDPVEPAPLPEQTPAERMARAIEAAAPLAAGSSPELLVALTAAAARAAQGQAIGDTAEQALTAADQYQSYVAANGMALLKDAMGQLRPPRTIAELDMLDKIVRRSLGLTEKGGGGKTGGHLRVDVSILNNHVAGMTPMEPTKALDVDGEIVEAELVE